MRQRLKKIVLTVLLVLGPARQLTMDPVVAPLLQEPPRSAWMLYYSLPRPGQGGRSPGEAAEDAAACPGATAGTSPSAGTCVGDEPFLVPHASVPDGKTP